MYIKKQKIKQYSQNIGEKASLNRSSWRVDMNYYLSLGSSWF